MQDKPLIGYTHEGYPVERFIEGQTLAFTLFCISHEADIGWSISLRFEFNKTAQGKKRPYMVLHLGRTIIQSGWLF